MEDLRQDLGPVEWEALEELARETGKRLRQEHIPSGLVDRGLVAADGCCWKLTKHGWCLLMFAGRTRERRCG
jgi:hypothetical protein